MRALIALPLGLLLACQSGEAPSKSKTPPTLQGVPPILITSKAMGPFTLGMSVGDVPKALPGLKLETGEDGDGLESLDFMIQNQALLSAYVGDSTPSSPLTDPTRKVEAMETFMPHPATQDGVRVGMRLKDVERIWGPVTKIVWTEIESREFVTFARSPKWLVMRTYGGIYPGGDQTKPTRKYEPDATLHSLAISSHRP
jgi:hypothetical protein